MIDLLAEGAISVRDKALGRTIISPRITAGL
jgi:hypothetical protein